MTNGRRFHTVTIAMRLDPTICISMRHGNPRIRSTVAMTIEKVPHMEQDDAAFNATTARLLRREALRRVAEELNSTSGPGLESVLGRISAEVTAEALEKHTVKDGETTPEPPAAPRQSHPSKP